MKQNNRGMTLIELVVALAILAIVSTSIFSMLLTGTKTYTKLTNTVKVQYDAQLASAKIEKQLLNCTDGIYWVNAPQPEQIIMVNDRTVHVYSLKEDTNTLYYGTAELENRGQTRIEMYVLAEHVKSMGIANEKTMLDDGKTYVKYVQLQMELERNNKTYKVDKTVSLRNTPQLKEYQLYLDF